ncbi:MAG: DUF4294 domain-containing protein [Polaribacter sp.]|jgi:hypothetical protein|nr:DUF4294 domain-containing protein [Polaribacter sp.]MDG1954494.1 DUF4294 domain-containing protein [Polaribacter sp.]
MKTFLYIYIVLFSFVSFGQKKDSIPLSEKYILIKVGDTLMIDLDEVKLLPKTKFKVREDVNYYYWFRKKVFKAYPFAILAAKRLDTLNSRLTRIKSKRKKKKYIKVVQRYLEGEFTNQLKSMTRTEGRVLLKLIHRQTGKTTFSQIKELKSGWNAFWYNTTANLFKLSLKKEYNPLFNNEDFLIEDVLQRAFIQERLVEKQSRLPINIDRMYALNKGYVNLEVYKKMFSKMRKKRSK